MADLYKCTSCGDWFNGHDLLESHECDRTAVLERRRRRMAYRRLMRERFKGRRFRRAR